MNINQVIAFLESNERRAGSLAKPHWRNAITELGHARRAAVQDRIDPKRPRVTPINRARFNG